MEADKAFHEDGELATIRIVIGKDLVYQELDGEMVILDMQSGQYFGIDLIGSRIWRLLEEQVPPAEIVERLLVEYEVAADVCSQQVLLFLRQLEKNQLIAFA